MKKIMVLCGIAAGLILASGCEWTGGGGAEYWDSSWDAVDFSGSYRASDGGLLVRAHDVASVVPGTVSQELLATGDGRRTSFAGSLAHPPVAGSLNITVGGYVFQDEQEGAGTVELQVDPDDETARGTVNYDTGAWSLSFDDPVASGTPMFASYTYFSVPQDNPGNSGEPIYSFVVYQTGNKLQIVDSNNGRYNGVLGNVTYERVGEETIRNISAQFSAEGVSQGYTVTIVGILKKSTIATMQWTGEYQDDGNQVRERVQAEALTMEATWIEETGKTAYINAESIISF